MATYKEKYLVNLQNKDEYINWEEIKE